MAGQVVEKGKRKWLVRVYMGTGPGGKRIYSNKLIHGTKKDAETYLNGVLRARDLGEFDPGATQVRMGELFDLVLRDYETEGKRLDWAEAVIRRHLRPHFGEMKAAAVNAEAAEAFKQKCLRAGQAVATVNRSLALLRRAFTLGFKFGKVRTLPKFGQMKENNARKGFFEHHEFLAIREALPEDLRALVTTAYYTGCRKGELLALEWRQVDLEEGLIMLDADQTKNDEPRILPMVPELLAMLKLERERRDAYYPHCEKVFSRHGEPIRKFGRRWENACVACGFVDADGKHTKLFHDFRRTGVRNLVRAGVPESIAMRISGHKTRDVFERYNIVDPKDLMRAAAKLAAHVESKEATRTPEENPHTIRTLGTAGRVQ